MKNQKQSGRQSSVQPGSPKSTKSGFSPVPLVVFGVGAALLVWLITSTFSPPAPGPAAPSATVDPGLPDGTAAAPAPMTAVADAGPPQELSDAARQRLLGSWQRTDAEYLINIRHVSADGRADAEYLNPRPINVSRANVVEAEDETGFFMELQDVGYPGSTYTLRYDGGGDTLAGIYFQAATQQSYEVIFARVR